MLDKIADFYDREVDSAAESLTAAIEPIMVARHGRRGRRNGRSVCTCRCSRSTRTSRAMTPGATGLRSTVGRPARTIARPPTPDVTGGSPCKTPSTGCAKRAAKTTRLHPDRAAGGRRDHRRAGRDRHPGVPELPQGRRRTSRPSPTCAARSARSSSTTPTTPTPTRPARRRRPSGQPHAHRLAPVGTPQTITVSPGNTLGYRHADAGRRRTRICAHEQRRRAGLHLQQHRPAARSRADVTSARRACVAAA